MHIFCFIYIKISMFINSKPIGIIDSGIGGLKICSNIHKKYPNEDIIYIADDKFMPYGNKTKTQILNRLVEISDFLIETYNVKFLILACNTASLTALKELKAKYTIPVIGVNPESADGIVLCTKLSAKHIKADKIFNKNLATCVEVNFFNRKKLEKIVKKIAQKNNLTSYKKIVLGCTHYEMIKPIFEKIIPNTEFLCPTDKTIEEFEQIYLKLDLAGSKSNLGKVFTLCSSESKAYADKLSLILEKYL